MPRLSRRQFLARGAGLAAALALPAPLLGDPYRPWPLRPARAPRPVRVTGRVIAGGRGVARAGISDGLQVVPTAPDGTFDLVTDGLRRYVTVTPPPGYAIPAASKGTFRLYQPIAADDRGEMAVRFDLDPHPGGDDRHAFLVLADTQTQNAADMGRLHAEAVPDVQATIGGLGNRPLFGVTNGDILWDDLSLYGEYERAVTAMGIPFAQVVGNHDLDLAAHTDEASTETFERHFGPRYYSFNQGRVHYVVLDNVFYHDGGYLGYLTQEQLTWLAADLAMVEQGSPVVVFLHIPLMSTEFRRMGQSDQPPLYNSTANREALVRLLEPYRARVISGHTHETEYRTEGGLLDHNLGAVCGAWWTGDLCWDGTPNGYAVYEVEGEELRWRYKATGRPDDYQVRLYPTGADPKAPDEVVANVWDATERWEVTWWTGGERRGLMQRRTGFDPETVRLQTGPGLPTIRSWIEPMATDHLYYARVPGGAGAVTVEARDPWGRTYRARLEP